MHDHDALRYESVEKDYFFLYISMSVCFYRVRSACSTSALPRFASSHTTHPPTHSEFQQLYIFSTYLHSASAAYAFFFMTVFVCLFLCPLNGWGRGQGEAWSSRTVTEQRSSLSR
jgi:hypothetical protein